MAAFVPLLGSPRSVRCRRRAPAVTAEPSPWARPRARPARPPPPAAQGRPLRPGPRPGPDPLPGDSGQPRGRPPSFSRPRKVSRRRVRPGCRSLAARRAPSCPRVMALAVRRAAARMGRDSESFSMRCGLLSSASSTRRSTILRAAPARVGATRAFSREPPSGRNRLSRERRRVPPLAAEAGAPCCAAAVRAGSMCSGGTLSILRSDSYVDLSQYRDQHFRVRAAGVPVPVSIPVRVPPGNAVVALRARGTTRKGC